MSVTIQITLPPESQDLIKRFSQMPDELPKAIKRGMDRSLEIVAGRIQEKRLTGKGPFPPAEHRLGVVTGILRASVRATPATIRGNEIEGAIGTAVVYGAVHEFGASYVRGFKRSAKAIRAGRATRSEFITRRVHVPERAPFRTGIAENTDYIGQQIMSEIKDTLEK